MSEPPVSSDAPVRVLVVDDEEPLRQMTSTILERAGFQPDMAEDVLSALQRLETQDYDVVLSDIMMPGLSGLDLLKSIHRTAPDVPVILMTGNPSLETATEAIRAHSAVDYLSKPVSSGDLIRTVERAAETKRMRDENRRLTKENDDYRQRLEGVVREQSEELVQAYGELRVSYDFTLEALVAMLDAREKATGRHSLRVRDLALIVGRAMALSDEALEQLARGTLLHDIGKIATPDAILLKPGKLTDEEWVIMKQHAQTGYDIVRSSDYLTSAAELILQHHEKFDGSGYPNGIKGKDICLGARIFSLVDAYDAMRSVRPYKKSMSKQEAVAEIKRCYGSHFDPEIVDVFLAFLPQLEACGGWDAPPRR